MKRGWYFKVVPDEGRIFLQLKKRVLGFFPVVVVSELVKPGEFLETKDRLIQIAKDEDVY